jgi:hypothetical protein
MLELFSVMLLSSAAQEPAPGVQAERDLQTSAETRLGSGDFLFEWVPNWARFPAAEGFGNTHGCIVVASDGRVYVNTDTERAVCVFEPDGSFVKSWGEDLRGGLHGMCLVREGEREVLYLAHSMRHEILKTTLDGEVLWTLGIPDASGLYERAGEYKPTSVAVAPSGDLYVADGYGKSWIHRFDAERKYLHSFGGPGEEPGKLQTPHGLWMDTRGEEPLLLVADRENHRLQWFDLEGEFVRALEGVLRRPCHVQARGEVLVVADLEGRITLLDGEDRLIAHLGDNPRPELRAQNGVPPADWKDGEFLAPHCAAFDATGNLYVMDWNATGRVNKLLRTQR